MMTFVREAAVAGMFYPGGAQDLARTIRRLLAEAGPVPDGPPPKAIIVPHAGYIYSGPIAAKGYVRLQPIAAQIRRVVLLGPAHRVAVRGLAASSAEAFVTPLGMIPCDRAAIDCIADLPQVHVADRAHAEEHSLEVHLPFLQEVLGQFQLVPLVAGDASAIEVAEVLRRLWGGAETVVVISSDLSHYLDYASARRHDAETCKAIEKLDANALTPHRACGCVPVSGLLVEARRQGLAVATLDLRNSGDTAGDRMRVVGYGAWMFTEPAVLEGRKKEERTKDSAKTWGNFHQDTAALLNLHGDTLLRVAMAAIDHGLAQGKPPVITARDYPDALQLPGASFVTLMSGGRLRGCVGSAEARRPLVEDVASNAYAAAFRDGRFPGLTAAERAAVHLAVSVLSPLEPMDFTDEGDLLNQLRPAQDGLVIADADARALFLPQVWSELKDPRTFLAQLKSKAGLSSDHWSPGMKAWRFVVETISSDSTPNRRTLGH